MCTEKQILEDREIRLQDFIQTKIFNRDEIGVFFGVSQNTVSRWLKIGSHESARDVESFESTLFDAVYSHMKNFSNVIVNKLLDIADTQPKVLQFILERNDNLIAQFEKTFNIRE